MDIDRGALMRDGDELKLRPQSFEVLRVLVTHHGRLVTRQQLHDEVWHNRAVTDDSLAQCMIDIRKALGDQGKTTIRTIPKRGFILEADVVVEFDDASNNTEQTWMSPVRLALACLVLAVIVTASWFFVSELQDGADETIERSVAVLPFVDLSENQNLAYLGHGLAEDIINSLSQSSVLQVTARTSSFHFYAAGGDISAIRDALNIAYVVEGSVRRSGQQIRVTAQLIDTANSMHVWSQQFDAPVSTLGNIQQQISADVLARIVPGGVLPALLRAQADVSATELMLLARHYERQVRDRPTCRSTCCRSRFACIATQSRRRPTRLSRTADSPAHCCTRMI